MKKKLGFITAIAAALMVASSAYASGTSHADISSNSTGVDGNYVSMKGISTVGGSNSWSSTNNLWVELYESLYGPDTLQNNTLIYPSRTDSFSLNLSSGTYYVHLDPDGPFFTGCNGWGNAVN